MGSFIILLGASMNIFIILEMLSAPNKYILEVIKMSIFKPYEQLVLKTFYFCTPIFVELPNDKGSLPKYFQNF